MSPLAFIFVYKAMLFLGFMVCVILAYWLFRKDDPQSVVDEFTFTKWFKITKPHSGTVFVAMAMVCFITMVTTKSEWRKYDNGDMEVDLVQSMPWDERRLVENVVESEEEPWEEEWEEEWESEEEPEEPERPRRIETRVAAAHGADPPVMAPTQPVHRILVEEMSAAIPDEPDLFEPDDDDSAPE